MGLCLSFGHMFSSPYVLGSIEALCLVILLVQFGTEVSHNLFTQHVTNTKYLVKYCLNIKCTKTVRHRVGLTCYK